MLINALFILLLFLTLFAIALWPVLFKNSAHKKAIFIGSNVIMIIMVIAFASAVYQTRQENNKRYQKMRVALEQVAAGLRSGTPPAEPFISIEVDEARQDNASVFEQLDQFRDQAQAYGKKSPEVQK